MQEATNQAIENNEVVVDEPVTEVESTETPDVDDSDVEKGAEDVAEDDSKEDDKEADDSEEEDTPFPKKATRALERRNKKINKLRAEKAELSRELAEYRNQPPSSEQIKEAPPPEGLIAPRVEDYEDDYAAFLRAEGSFEAKKEFAQERAQAQDQQTESTHREWVGGQVKAINDKAAELKEAIPNLDGLYAENEDIITGYSDETKQAFLEAGTGSVLAFVALATEGRLEELDGMSPSRLAREIALAEIRGEKLSKTRPVSKAPAPMKKVRGSSPQPRSLADMAPTELLNHLKKSKR